MLCLLVFWLLLLPARHEAARQWQLLLQNLDCQRVAQVTAGLLLARSTPAALLAWHLGGGATPRDEYEHEQHIESNSHVPVYCQTDAAPITLLRGQVPSRYDGHSRHHPVLLYILKHHRSHLEGVA
jgi:hypothetical protein